jgi:hypothetical protein
VKKITTGTHSLSPKSSTTKVSVSSQFQSSLRRAAAMDC